MARYFQDPEFTDFHWVVGSLGELQARPGLRFWYATRGVETQFITLGLKPNVLLDAPLQTMPGWAITCRNDWMDFIKKNSKFAPAPKNLKPNPALPILQRLSGLDEKALREIITDFLELN